MINHNEIIMTMRSVTLLSRRAAYCIYYVIRVVARVYYFTLFLSLKCSRVNFTGVTNLTFLYGFPLIVRLAT